jgi:hypothetical protein
MKKKMIGSAWGMPRALKSHEMYGKKLSKATSSKLPSKKKLKKLWGKDGVKWDRKRIKYVEDEMGAFA